VSGLFVGNDVVDLLDPRTRGKHEDRRFVDRVLSPTERALLVAAPDPRLELWSLWAAKEAAYKVVSKVSGAPPVFAHAAFAVSWAGDASVPRTGTVHFGGFVVPVSVSTPGAWVHATAVSGPEAVAPAWAVAQVAQAATGALLASLSAAEANAVHSSSSAAVRLGARRALARLLSVEERRLEIVCDPGVTGRRPPRVLQDGRPAHADVSLSHHGRWLAWAVLRLSVPWGDS
jgi:phosphopantetheinyl transferase (holo-ACP synthase)